MVQRCVLILLALTLAAAGQTKSTTKGSSGTSAASTTPAGPPTAIIHTTAGDMKCELFPDKAPKTVANFIGLATGQKDWTNPNSGKTEHDKPLYDGTTFHRVIPGFVIQGGDPTGTGNGDPGYKFEDELTPDLLYDKPGRLAMANSGPNTNGSQFFITEEPLPSLNPCLQEGGCEKPFPPPNNHVPKGTGWTIFGQCDDATVELAKKIAQGPCRGQVCNTYNSHPDNPVKITHIEILNAPKPPKPAAKPSARKKKK
jgi:peptidyl-prolyl cis-trans isomerase A (cyclophilin A)